MSLFLKGLNFAAGRMPKVLNPTAHAVLDYAVAGSFLVMGAVFWKKQKRAAISSFVCGGAAITNSLLTDYPGGVFKVMSYKNHGRVDAGLIGLSSAMPRFMGFEGEPEGRFFGIAAMAETTVVGLTDFDYYEDASHGRLRSRDDEAGPPQTLESRSRRRSG